MTTGMTLVIGGTGRTGRRVAERLADRGHPVRIGTRTADPPFDWLRETSWPEALEGVESLYVTYQPDLAVPAAPDAIRALTRLARERDIKHLVLLSGRGEREAQRCERIVQDSGVPWTILRCSWFAQNFSDNFFLDGLLAGDLILPAGDVGEPFVDLDDVADVAAAALTEEGHVGQLYEITGPRLWTLPEAVAEIASATGREIRYSQVPMDGYAAELARLDTPSDPIWLVTYLFTEVLDGRNAWIADGVQRALGRPARDFSAYVRETAPTGVWNAA
ncbi:MAG: NAD(P)H-binding protein [Gemmatimonas sp.]|nr:NAD(P)H-binding protein [Gemmatimonas sp.]